jgi:hypothetical protein
MSVNSSKEWVWAAYQCAGWAFIPMKMDVSRVKM